MRPHQIVKSGIVQVAAGWNYGLALGADGKVYGWGWNSSGQTGDRWDSG